MKKADDDGGHATSGLLIDRVMNNQNLIEEVIRPDINMEERQKQSSAASISDLSLEKLQLAGVDFRYAAKKEITSMKAKKEIAVA